MLRSVTVSNKLIKKKYDTDGYFILKNELNILEKNLILGPFKNTIQRYLDIKFNNFSDFNLHRDLLQLRKSNPEKFSDLYDDLNLNSIIKSIFFKKKYLNFFSTILNTSVDNIYLNGFMFRMDAPKDKRNSLDWHQDSAYYEMTSPKFNSGVCWISITNNTKLNGTLQFIPGSHHKGFYHPKKNKSKKNISEQNKLIIKKEKIKNLNSNFGDLSFFHINMIHRSGVNTSKKIRFTIGCRYHDLSKNFNLGKEIYLYKKNGKKRLFF